MFLHTADSEILLWMPKSHGIIMDFGFTAIEGPDSALLGLSPTVHCSVDHHRTEKSLGV